MNLFFLDFNPGARSCDFIVGSLLKVTFLFHFCFYFIL